MSLKDSSENRRLSERQSAFQVNAPIAAATTKSQEIRGKNPLDPKPVVVTLIGESNASKTFFLNSILRTTTPQIPVHSSSTSDPGDIRNRHDIEIPFKVHKTKTVSLSFYRNLGDYVAGWLENEIRLQPNQTQPLNPDHSFLLPETFEPSPTIRIKYGTTTRMFVTYPTVQSLQQSIHQIICLGTSKIPAKSNADRIRQEYLTKFTNNKKPFRLQRLRHWEHIKIKDEYLTLGLLGNTIQYKALGEDFYGSDRYFVRESLKEIFSGIGCFAESILIQIPSPMLKDNIEFNLSDSDCFFPRDREACVSNIDRSDIVVVLSSRGSKKGLSNATMDLLSMSERFLNNLQDYPDNKLILAPIFNIRIQPHNNQDYSLTPEESTTYNNELYNFFTSRKIPFEKVHQRVHIISMNIITYLMMCKQDENLITNSVNWDDRAIKKKQTNVPSFLNILKTKTILHCAEPMRAGLHIWMRRQRNHFDSHSADRVIARFTAGIDQRYRGLLEMAEKYQVLQFMKLKASPNLEYANQAFPVFCSKVRCIPGGNEPNFGSRFAVPLEQDVVRLTCSKLLSDCHSWWISTVLRDIPDTFKFFAELSGEIIRECRRGLESKSSLLKTDYYKRVLEFWDGLGENQLPAIIKQFKFAIYEQADVIVSNCCLRAVQSEITPMAKDANTVGEYLQILKTQFSAVTIRAANAIAQQYTQQLQIAAHELDRLRKGISQLQDSVSGHIATVSLSQMYQIVHLPWNPKQYGASSSWISFVQKQLRELRHLDYVPQEKVKKTQFAAVAHQIYKTETAHRSVRLLALHEILRNPNDYSSQIKTEFPDYISKMTHDDEQGDHVTLHAIASAFHVNILLYSPLLPQNPVRIQSKYPPIFDIRIAYLNHNEYYSLIPWSGNTEIDTQPNTLFQRFPARLTKDKKIAKQRSSSCCHPRFGSGTKVLIPSLTRLCILQIVESLDMLPILDGALPEELVQPIIRETIAQGKLDGVVLQKLLHEHIMRLDVSNSRITNEILADVSSFCPNLHEISLANCPNISTKGIRILATNCKELRTIDLERCNIDGEAVSALHHCKHLVSINLAGCTNISPSVMKEILRFPTIQNLSFKHCTQVTEDIFEQLSDKLQQLDISECDKITDSAVLKIANNTCNLKSFKLSGKLLTDRSISQFVNTFPELEHLELNGCDCISGDTVRGLAGCKQLAVLDLSCCGYISPGAFAPSINPPLRNLKQLNLSSCKNVTDETLEHISQCSPALSILNLSYCEDITDAGLVHVSEFHSLRELNISMCIKITDRSIIRIADQCPRLTTLIMYRCCVTDQSINVLARYCRDMEHIDISSCENLKGDCFSQFPEGFPNLSILKVNDLSSIHSKAAEKLATCVNLTEFHASRCTAITADVLLKVARGCPLVHTLDLSHLDHLSVEDIQSAIGYWSSLQRLRVRNYSKFTTQGFSHSNLEELTIPWSSSFNDECLVFVAEYCPRLQNIDLAWCSSVTEESVEILLAKCPISSINIRGTAVPSSSASIFATSCSVRY